MMELPGLLDSNPARNCLLLTLTENQEYSIIFLIP